MTSRSIEYASALVHAVSARDSVTARFAKPQVRKSEGSDDIAILTALTTSTTQNSLASDSRAFQCPESCEDVDTASETSPVERGYENAPEAVQIALSHAVEA